MMPPTSRTTVSSSVTSVPVRRPRSTSAARPRDHVPADSSVHHDIPPQRPQHLISRSSYQGRQSQPTTTLNSSDPFTTRHQAEAAALEAYYRAQLAQQDAPLGEYRPAPAKLQRRRSRVSGRTEGGHFEDARLGRRKSGNAKTKSDSAAAEKVKSSPRRKSETESTPVTAVPEAREGERIITRRRSVIPPASDHEPQRTSEVPPTVSAGRTETRRSHIGCENGSPMPRQGQIRSSRGDSYETYTSSEKHSMIEQHGPIHSSTPARYPDSPARRATPLGRNIVAVARDKHLQDFQQKKIRERKSMLLAPFQKLKAANTHTSRTSGFDVSLPPYNYADEELSIPPPPAPPPSSMLPSDIPIYTLSTGKKGRNITESLKGRLRKAFRKSSRTSSELPSQQVEGRTYNFSTTTPSSKSSVVPTKEDDPFSSIINQYLEVPDVRAASAASKQTANTTTKSRLTSWTNSTVAGTWSTRSALVPEVPADEHGRLQRSGSVSTLRKAKSFFGRPIQNKLRRPSKAQLQNSEESTGLYSALQDRINPSDSASQGQDQDNIDSAASRYSSALATLPSQRQAEPARTGLQNNAAPTIRSVTPDPMAYRLGIMSPVAEVMSPDAVPSRSTPKTTDDEETPKSQLKRRPATKAPTPSQEQIARRMERSKNRWQAPLDEMSPNTHPRSSRAGMMDDNPYELRSLSQTLQPPIAANNDLPHHARIGKTDTTPDMRANNVLSPSVYSRASDGASPRPDTPVEQSGMMITITGREVRSYSISPKKRELRTEQPVLGSSEWRRWLSDEMKGFGGATTGGDLLPETVIKSIESTALRTKGTRDTTDSEERPASSSPPLIAPALETSSRRPRARSSRSSFMNERYPMVGTGRQSCDTRKVSSRGESRRGSAESGFKRSISPVMNDHEASTADEARPVSVIHHPRMVSKHQSHAELRSAHHPIQVDGSEEAVRKVALPSIYPSTTTALPVEHQEASSKSSSRATKSAFDLRANYRTHKSGQVKSINVNRQSPHRYTSSSPIHILEDTTIQNISAGPYATHHRSSPIPMSANVNKENSPLTLLASEPNNLPALSSSEWLATGSSKARNRKVSMAHPALRDRSVSRYSPVRTGEETISASPKGERSPGQRMVTNWLDGKRSKENSPAFV